MYPKIDETKSGCFIWKNISGNWMISCFGLGNKIITGSILSQEKVTLCSQELNKFKFQKDRDNLFIFEGNVCSPKAGLSFSSKGDWFDIDIRIDGCRQPDMIFFGEKCSKPQALPVRVLDNAPSINPCHFMIEKLIDKNDSSFSVDSRESQRTSEEEKIPDKKDVSKDRRYKSQALKQPDYLKDWPPIEPPKIPKSYPDENPDDPKHIVTVVYDVAKDEIRAIKDPESHKN